MKIILVATDRNGRNLIFVSDDIRVYSLEETFRLINSGKIDAHIVKGQNGNYVRSALSAAEEDNFDYISVSGRDIIFYANQIRTSSTSLINRYLQRYSDYLKDHQPFLKPVEQDELLKVSVTVVKRKFDPHAHLIDVAAKEFNIDKYLLGAILIDELARILPFEQIIEPLLMDILGRNVSVGVIQVKLETANKMIKIGLYNPNPGDRKLPFKGTLSNEDRAYLYKYVIQPKHNIKFGAAYIRFLIDQWMKVIDISKRPEIVATMYHLAYHGPNPNPTADKRGDQIASEFYKLSKKWLT